jgi:hypothetical protein
VKMRLLKWGAVGAAAIGASGLMVLGAPAAGADNATDVARPSQSAQLRALSCQNWTLKITEGHASGTWCNNYTTVSGTVTDDKADGRCPYVRSTWSNGGVSDSAAIGPKGASRSFTLYAPSGTTSTQVSIHYVYC